MAFTKVVHPLSNLGCTGGGSFVALLGALRGNTRAPKVVRGFIFSQHRNLFDPFDYSHRNSKMYTQIDFI